MKKAISLLLCLLLVLTMVVGCGRNKETTESSDDQAAANESAENTENSDESNDVKNDDADTELFGIPKGTEDYDIIDLTDPENEFFVKNDGSIVFGIEAYYLVSEENENGEHVKGSNFFIWAKYGKALKIKEITYTDETETYNITLEEVEKGTPQAYELLNIVCRKPFKDQVIKHTDGTELTALEAFAEKVGGFRRDIGEFQQADISSNTVDISSGDFDATTYTMVDVPTEALEGLQKGDKVEFIRGYDTETVYAIRKYEE